MDYIKQLFLSRFKTFALVSISILFSIFLLMIRMKLTYSFFYLFLVWNLFLAVIPFAITTYLVSLPKLNKYVFILWFCIWLLFLPNAPYIITDLLHLKVSTTHLLWLDILVIMAFALTGIMLFYLSINDMKTMLLNLTSKKKANYISSTTIFLSGFGVYLGRFLRYNSWEIISNPKVLFIDILNIAVQPFDHQEAWLFTILFGLFLTLGYCIFNQTIKQDTI
ncbi:DUF1361 domain-containing protein [Algibacter pectinivorans]|uniref:Uncharacterized membrane protein n=1 Tax=Algibacter pectinivorans TaxID=870482 RepID=A0A1I1Q629_9FLAO|nr:DUF1361 domain-containing protein [Algibacter pectinivorans]SFD17467.1 Uncharacterized membrane protein [Algibacter pectinivorans]